MPHVSNNPNISAALRTTPTRQPLASTSAAAEQLAVGLVDRSIDQDALIRVKEIVAHSACLRSTVPPIPVASELLAEFMRRGPDLPGLT
jgi:hypothetical protein